MTGPLTLPTPATLMPLTPAALLKRRAIQGLVFLFPLVAATVHHGAGTILTLLMLMGLFLGWPAWRELKHWEKRVLVGLLVFVALVSLSLVNADDMDNALRKLEKPLQILLVPLVYLVIRRYRVDVSQPLAWGAALGAIGLLLTASYQADVLGKVRPHGAYHAIIFGDVAIILAVVSGAALLTLPLTWRQRVLFTLAVGSGLATSVMSQTRGAWLALPVLVVALAWLYRRHCTTRQWTVMLLAAVLALGAFTFGSDTVRERFGQTLHNLQHFEQNANSSTGLRVLMWRDAATIWRDHPFIGSGLGDFDHDSRRLIEQGRTVPRQIFDHAHNIYMDALATTGLVGLAGLLLFLFWRPFRAYTLIWVRGTEPSLRFLALSGVLVLIACAVFGMTEGWLSRNPFVRTYLFYLIIPLAGAAVILARDQAAALQPPQRLLVVRNDKLGDFMLAWPAFAQLKQSLPNTEIHALVPAYTAELAETCPWIDQVIIDPGQASGGEGFVQLVKDLRRQDYDGAITLFSTTRIGAALLLAGIRQRLAPATKLAQVLYSDRLRQHRSQSAKPEHEYNRELALHFLHENDLPAAARPRPPLLTIDTEALDERKRRFLTEEAIPADHKLVFVHPGSGGSANNLAPAQFQRLAASLRSGGHTVVVTAGPGETETAQAVVEALHGQDVPAVLYVSAQGLVEFAKHLALADVFISGSTGPLHMAGALNRPTAAFYPRSRVNNAIRWQTLNEDDRQLAFAPPESAEPDDMSAIDLESAAAAISGRFLN